MAVRKTVNLQENQEGNQGEVDAFRGFILNPQGFIQKLIIEPYNVATGKNIVMTTQQKETLKGVSELINAKLKLKCGQTLTEKETELSKKLGVSVMAGKGLGKDTLAAWLIIWFTTCFPNCKVPCISVSADQLNKVLWAEIATWLQFSPLKELLTLQNDKLFFNQVPEEFRGKKWFAFPKAANPKSGINEQVETLAGIHEDFVMVVADEAAGMATSVFDPLESTLTKPVNFVFMIFNPTRTKGYAIDSQYKNSRYWITYRWSAIDSEIGNKDVIERTENMYTKDSTPYRVRILGLPPLSETDALISYDQIEDAVNRELTPVPDDPLIMSFDCGAGRDLSVIGLRKGGTVYPFRRFTTTDSNRLVAWVRGLILDLEPAVFIGDHRGWGWHVIGELRKDFANSKTRVLSFDSSQSAKSRISEEKFFNWRSESYWKLKQAFENGLISIPDDPNLKDQLSVIKVDNEDPKGRFKIIKKSEIKKLMTDSGTSPDEADTIAMGYAFDDRQFRKVPDNDEDKYERRARKMEAYRGEHAFMGK